MSIEKTLSGKKSKIISEKRRYVRISPREPMHVKYRFVEDSKEPDTSLGDALSSSVSGGGLFLELPYLEPGAVEELLKGRKKLALKIELPNLDKPIKALAQVIWMEGKKEGYGVGVSFIRIDENDRNEIINYIIDFYLQGKKSK